jgi:hypothetical protein
LLASAGGASRTKNAQQQNTSLSTARPQSSRIVAARRPSAAAATLADVCDLIQIKNPSADHKCRCTIISCRRSSEPAASGGCVGKMEGSRRSRTSRDQLLLAIPAKP